MSVLRGAMYRLKTKAYEPDIDIARSPLGQRVDRATAWTKGLSRRSSMMLQRRQSLSPGQDRAKSPDRVDPEMLLGNKTTDWSERGFELCHTTCELRYRTTKLQPGDKESKHAPSHIAVGFVQQHTTVCVGPYVESVDRIHSTGEKLCLHTLEIAFYPEHAIHATYCILGHPEESERDRWLTSIELLISKKSRLHDGWQRFRLETAIKNASRADEWLKRRTGALEVQLNMAARRKARLLNGKVLQDVPKVFERYSEDCPAWPLKLLDSEDYMAARRVMDVSHIVEALAELGLDLAPKVAKRVLDDVQKNPPCPDIPDKVDLQRFELIFRSCCVEFLVSPSDEMKENLIRIMQDSKNPFLSLLSPAEQKYLIEGKDADGKYFCTCKSYVKDTVLVQQGDEGDSMFIIIEGSLSVIVTFGVGESTLQKEVAVLSSGSVMGEMSLVLGKPRSATCVVKSESASVAEISKTAMVLLLDGRPSLARELEDMVYRRDTANYLSAGNNAAAMAAYRERGSSNAAGRGGGGGGSVPVSPSPRSSDGRLGSRCGRVSRIQSRLSKVPPRRLQTSLPPIARAGRPPPLARSGSDSALGGQADSPSQAFRVGGNLNAAGPGAEPALPGGRRVKTGRWVKCRGVYVFVVD